MSDKVFIAMKNAKKILKNKKKGDGKGKKSQTPKNPDGFTQFVMDKARSDAGAAGGINPLDPRKW